MKAISVLCAVSITLGASMAHADDLSGKDTRISNQQRTPTPDQCPEYEPAKCAITAEQLRRFEPSAVPGRWRYGTTHLFGLTRGVARSTATDASRGFWFLFSVPFDIAFLPFGLLAGFAGSK